MLQKWMPASDTPLTMPRASIMAVAVLVMLGGCGKMADSLGISKSAPDEFTVVSKAPLVVPPEFNLRPPDPSKPFAADIDPQLVAFQALFPNGTTLPPATDGERALLVLTGANTASSDARHGLTRLGAPSVRKGAFTREILYGMPDSDPNGPEIERLEPLEKNQ